MDDYFNFLSPLQRFLFGGRGAQERTTEAGLDSLVQQARYYTTDQDGQGGGRVPTAYLDAANSGATYTMPHSTNPTREYLPSDWLHYLVQANKTQRTRNPFFASEADLNGGYPASGISTDHRLKRPAYPTGLLGPP
jgi:hypothetical protein